LSLYRNINDVRARRGLDGAEGRAISGRYCPTQSGITGRNKSMDAIPLNRANLSQLQPPIRVPGYDTAKVTPGIVHLGFGGFHRAHMARYMHDLMERQPQALEWGIAGAGIMPADRRMRDSLVPQDCLYTLVERAGSDERVTVIGSAAKVIFAGESSAELLDEIANPRIRIVSLTVTENGYCLNRATKQLDPDHKLIREDLAHPEQPRSPIGIIVEAYRRRRESGGVAFTAMTCDNIQHNGNVLRGAVRALATLRDKTLADWIEAHASFPNTMVDRITPVTAPEEVEALRQKHGIIDGWPVFSEQFIQWVIEDQFVQGRPAWEEVGAQFVPDVTPYEFMKLGVDLDQYKRTLVERFSNTAIKDTVERVNTDAPLNVLVDPIRDRLKSGGTVDLLALALAAWMRRIRGEDEQGQIIEIRHPLADLLRQKAIEGGPDARPLLSIEQLFGEMGRDERLIRPAARWLASLYETGCRKTLQLAAEELAF
jgi:mannitol 2-dehydrogenase